MARPIISGVHELRREDVVRSLNNAKRFLAPLGAIYIASLLPVFSDPNNTTELRDFVPSQLAQGAMILYILNFVNDVFNKWKEETKYLK
jgi:hypothetical protein